MTGSRVFSAVLLLSCLACATRSTAPVDVTDSIQHEGTVTLTVEILGLESDEGSVALALFDSAESFDGQAAAVASQTVAPMDGGATWRLTDLPAGLYAVAAFHDLNDNGELDRSALGPPSEPYGFSNDARGTFGPPRFDKAAIELLSGQHTIRIRVR